MIYCDTSILVASSVLTHKHYPESISFLENCIKKNILLSMSTHGLAEYFNAISRYVFDPPVTIHQIIEIVERQIQHFKVIPLTEQDYVEAMKNLDSRQLRGPIIYDALHYQAARKANAKNLVTWNLKDFVRLSSDEIGIETPESFMKQKSSID